MKMAGRARRLWIEGAAAEGNGDLDLTHVAEEPGIWVPKNPKDLS